MHALVALCTSDIQLLLIKHIDNGSERGDPALFLGEDVQGSKREIEQFGAFEMAMKGRGDWSLGRCEGHWRKVDGTMRGVGGMKATIGRDQKGNKPIRYRALSSLVPEDAEINHGVHL